MYIYLFSYIRVRRKIMTIKIVFALYSTYIYSSNFFLSAYTEKKGEARHGKAIRKTVVTFILLIKKSFSKNKGVRQNSFSKMV